MRMLLDTADESLIFQLPWKDTKNIWIIISLAVFLPSFVGLSSLWSHLEAWLGSPCSHVVSLALYQEVHLVSSRFPTNPVLRMWIPPRFVSHPEAFHVVWQMCVWRTRNRCQHSRVTSQWSIQLMRPVCISANQWQKAQFKGCNRDTSLGLDVWRAWILLEAAEDLERCCQIFIMTLASILK